MICVIVFSVMYNFSLNGHKLVKAGVALLTCIISMGVAHARLWEA